MTKYSANLNGRIYSVKINLLSNNTGMYLISQDNSSPNLNVWKFVYSPSAIIHWFEVSNMNSYCYIQVKLSDNSLFIQGLHSSDKSLRIMKISFGLTTADWSYSIGWSIASWSSSRGEAIVNSQ